MKKIKIKKRYIYTFLGICLIILGILIFSYPFGANFLSTLIHEDVIRNYEKLVSNLSEEEIEENLIKASSYNQSLLEMSTSDLYGGYEVPDTYEEILNIYGNGVIGYIEIPKIDVYLPIYHGTDEDVLSKGVGHLEQSSFPIGETSSHSILTGHTGLASSTLFSNLTSLEVGDLFYIHILDSVYTYEVYEILVVEPTDISNLGIEEGRDLVTLVTCTPYGVNTHRLLVKGERVYTETSENVEDESSYNVFIYVIIAVLCVLIVILFLSLVIHKHKVKNLQNKRKEKQKEEFK